MVEDEVVANDEVGDGSIVDSDAIADETKLKVVEEDAAEVDDVVASIAELTSLEENAIDVRAVSEDCVAWCEYDLCR